MKDLILNSLALIGITGNKKAVVGKQHLEGKAWDFAGTTHNWPADPVVGVVKGVAFLFKQLSEDGP